MEKNIKMEQQLSEEQLQTITGGCKNCDNLHTQINSRTVDKQMYDRNIAQNAQKLLNAGSGEESDKYQLRINKNVDLVGSAKSDIARFRKQLQELQMAHEKGF